MPQFKVAKTDSKTKLDNKAKLEDKLYIFKETNKLGKIYYDFDDNTRIEIGPSTNIYYTPQIITDDIKVDFSINYLYKYNETDSDTQASIDEISVNELVIASQSIYSIRSINRANNTVILRRVYTQSNLSWNDYYE